jgi:hypothetical protein
VVRSGLNNPRRLTETWDGLYVAEAGAGVPTGAVTLIKHGHIASSVKLPSVIQAGSSEVAGPAAVAFGHGQSAVVMQDVLVNSHGVTACPSRPGTCSASS